jgi:hypothetical protein
MRAGRVLGLAVAVALAGAPPGRAADPASGASDPRAGETIETVAVGNPGNPGEQSRIPSGDQTFYGGVAYTYAIGKYEVTAGQYTAFLDAVAALDPEGLYNTKMDYDADPSREGCNIKRHGAPGSYTYSVAPDWADRPVNYVSWADAARFANWLHNAHENSESPYGTFDQGGNVMEFTEAVPQSDIRRIRGGSWFWGGSLMSVFEVDDVMHSSDQFSDLGFRVAKLAVDPVSVPSVGSRAGLRFAIGGPHPFREEARFLIELPQAGRVRIDVFDVAGRRLPGSVDEALPAGAHEVTWRAGGLAPGIYLARVRALGQSATLRFVRLR